MGAEVANYVKGTDLIVQDNHISRVTVRDQLSGQEFSIASKMVLNTCGGWVNQFLNNADAVNTIPRIQLSTALNLVVNKKLLQDNAAGVYSNYPYVLPDGSRRKIRRVLFMAPWREHTIIGTFHRPYESSPDQMQITELEIREALEEANTALHNQTISRDEISLVLKGFLPMDGIDKNTGEVILTKHYTICDHHKENGISGLISVSGVKYTTARDVAEKSIKLILKKLGKNIKSVKHNKMRLSGGAIDNYDHFLTDALHSYGSQFREKTIRHLVLNYGSALDGIIQYCTDNPELSKLIKGSDEVIQAEILYAVREEMAQTLSDVILRRTDLGSAGNPGDTVLTTCADLMASELNWDQNHKNKEIDTVKKFYTTTKEKVS
ncbi:MAG: glycerol-3-phosphate dehydrogenase C-terminal domain-containing protein [bacterium]